ncbi:sigma-70 family RNA polymerase sigma factor [Caldicellulosiruptor morganii]|uniref:Sigma-70 family RNA polymerase sigma factor n=2 Tax=Caldicellulosiruptor morganii TaxID=1387555 RepID=A0ABY7BL88_9FIRM|nr:sigma-70 family RNA polymerase sigma factor [Caldicellulosiruptor morganii]WAM33612.1 sigma-70 family RNA polymerase sigma factor [Caldicellulosiruptor morganii]
MLKTPKEAEDIAQEVFYKLIKNPPREDNIQGWLITVAKNLAINYLKSQKRIYIGEETIICSQTSQDDIEILQVKMTLEKLPDEQKDLLLLKYSGYTYEEIAKIMNINPNSVGTMIARAQKKFRKIYEEGEGE